MPFAFAAARKIIKNSSIALLLNLFGQLIDFKLLLFIIISPILSPHWDLIFLRVILPPIFFKIFNAPSRVGFKFTDLILSWEFLLNKVSTIKNEAEEKSPPTLKLNALKSFCPSIEIRF